MVQVKTVKLKPEEMEKLLSREGWGSYAVIYDSIRKLNKGEVLEVSLDKATKYFRTTIRNRLSREKAPFKVAVKAVEGSGNKVFHITKI